VCEDPVDGMRQWFSENGHKVREIRLSSSSLYCIPSEMMALSNVERIHVLYSRIPKLPHSVSFPVVRLLNLVGNGLEVFPEDINLPLLEDLFLGQNKIRGFSQSLGTLSQMRMLDVRSNPLSSLPCSLQKCSRLCQVILFDTSIATYDGPLLFFRSLKRACIERKLRDSICLPPNGPSLVF